MYPIWILDNIYDKDEQLIGFDYKNNNIRKAGLSTCWAPGLKFYLGPFDKHALQSRSQNDTFFFNYFTNYQLHYKIIKLIGI
jgi:hypothetical protein